MSLLDWCSDLQAQPEYTKAEFCYLASLVDPDHACLNGVTFENKGYQMMAHVFLPARFSKPASIENTGFNDNDYPARKFNNAVPTYETYTLNDLATLAHEVMFATDFGAVALNNTAVRDALRSATTNHFEIYAECLLARALMGDTPTAQEVQPVEDWHSANWPPTWATYHPFIVAEMLFAEMAQ